MGPLTVSPRRPKLKQEVESVNSSSTSQIMNGTFQFVGERVSVVPDLYACAYLQVLLQKCLGRRICKGCGAKYNIADIDLPATKHFPAVQMPPLIPKESCKDNLCTRPDDNEEVFWRRMQVFIVP